MYGCVSVCVRSCGVGEECLWVYFSFKSTAELSVLTTVPLFVCCLCVGVCLCVSVRACLCERAFVRVCARLCVLALTGVFRISVCAKIRSMPTTQVKTTRYK